MKLLFICSQNRLRSPTAKAVFSRYPGIETMSAGTDNDAVTPVSFELIKWADVVFAMERSHRDKLTKEFRTAFKAKRLIVLNIADEFDYMDSKLVRILKAEVPIYIKHLTSSYSRNKLKIE